PLSVWKGQTASAVTILPPPRPCGKGDGRPSPPRGIHGPATSGLNLLYRDGLAWGRSVRVAAASPGRRAAMRPPAVPRAGRATTQQAAQDPAARGNAMAENSAQARSRLIGQVIQAARKRLPPTKAERAEAFIRQFFANVPPSDLRGDSPENLAGGALALWQRLEQRPPGKASVTAYNPVAAKDGWDSPHSIVEIINDDMPFLV